MKKNILKMSFVILIVIISAFVLSKTFVKQQKYKKNIDKTIEDEDKKFAVKLRKINLELYRKFFLWDEKITDIRTYLKNLPYSEDWHLEEIFNNTGSKEVVKEKIQKLKEKNKQYVFLSGKERTIGDRPLYFCKVEVLYNTNLKEGPILYQLALRYNDWNYSDGGMLSFYRFDSEKEKRKKSKWIEIKYEKKFIKDGMEDIDKKLQYFIGINEKIYAWDYKFKYGDEHYDLFGYSKYPIDIKLEKPWESFIEGFIEVPKIHVLKIYNNGDIKIKYKNQRYNVKAGSILVLPAIIKEYPREWFKYSFPHKNKKGEWEYITDKTAKKYTVGGVSLSPPSGGWQSIMFIYPKNKKLKLLLNKKLNKSDIKKILNLYKKNVKILVNDWEKYDIFIIKNTSYTANKDLPKKITYSARIRIFNYGWVPYQVELK